MLTTESRLIRRASAMRLIALVTTPYPAATHTDGCVVLFDRCAGGGADGSSFLCAPAGRSKWPSGMPGGYKNCRRHRGRLLPLPLLRGAVI